MLRGLAGAAANAQGKVTVSGLADFVGDDVEKAALRLFKERLTLWEGEAYLDKPCSIMSLLQAVSLLLFGSSETPAELTAAPPS